MEIRCIDCQKKLKKLPLKEAIKNKDWWKQEIRDFGIDNLLIIIAVVLLFSGLFFEFGPKIKNPCDWCKVSIKDSSGEISSRTCTEWLEEKYEIDGLPNIEVDNGNIENFPIG